MPGILGQGGIEVDSLYGAYVLVGQPGREGPACVVEYSGMCVRVWGVWGKASPRKCPLRTDLRG